MNLLHIRTRLFLLIVFIVSVAAAPMYAELRFASSSRLASGRWVKFAVDETGVYELSYDTLRNLGFPNPLRVSVFGSGGTMADENFTDASGRQLYVDDLHQVAVSHASDKLIFYAEGVETVRYTEKFGAEKGVFLRDKRNRYTERGYYFLTDSEQQPLQMRTVPVPSDTGYAHDAAATLARGFGYAYHEKDISLGIKNTGNTFLGESFNRLSTCRRYVWNTYLPDAEAGATARMVAPFYRDYLSGGTLSFGIEGSGPGYSRFSYAPKNPLVSVEGGEPADVVVNSERADVFVSFQPDGLQQFTLEYCHLDYWTLTYPRTMPSLSGLSQDRILFPGVAPDSVYRIKAASASHKALLVSDGQQPAILRPDTEGYFSLVASEPEIELVVFDDSRKLRTPLGYEAVANTNLHAQASKGAEMLIVCKSDMMQVGEAIAALHREHDGIDVIVADVEDVYNEFSSGRPDPMAIRALAKMMYSYSSVQLENILLIGLAQADVKTGYLSGMPAPLIFPQYGLETAEPLGHNHIDFYANMDAYTSASPERRRINVGIGLLPCLSPAEGMNYVEKLSRYMTAEGAGSVAGNLTNIGGVGDSNLHISQSDEVAATAAAQAPGRFTRASICGAALEAPSHTDRFYKELGNSAFIFYSGHGAEMYIDHGSRLFDSYNLNKIKNNHLGFMMFAGCNLTGTDRGIRGLSEQLVLGTRHGLIGCITSMRDTYANTNKYMVNHLARAMSDGSLSSNSYDTPSIGALYARMKTNNTYQNELTYTLIGDPALKLHLAVADIDATIAGGNAIPGRRISVSADVKGKEKELLDRFNGTGVARLLIQRPDISLDPDYNPPTSDTVPYIYTPPYEMVAVRDIEVAGGRISFEMRVPSDIPLDGKTALMLSISAYDAVNRTGAAACMTLPVDSSPSGPDETERDLTPPVIESVQYLPSAEELMVKTSDNVALSFSMLPLQECFTMSMDGELCKTFPGLRQQSVSEYEMTLRIPLPDLSDGPHTALISVRDEAGNTSSQGYTFIKGTASVPKMFLRDSDKFDPTALTAELELDLPEDSSVSQVIVLDSEGREVRRLQVNGTVALWNITDDKGRCPAGLYRAVAVGKDAKGFAWQSNTVYIPVL